MNLLYDKEKLDKICNEKGISKLLLFGSYARNENTKKSDVDLIVNYHKPTSLLQHANTQNTLSDFLQLPVDLVIENQIKPRIQTYITNDLITLYEKR